MFLIKKRSADVQCLISNFMIRSTEAAVRRCSSKYVFLKILQLITRKHLCWNLFLIQLQSCSPATILKSNSSTGVFLWTLPNFKEHLFWKTSANGCFLNLMKCFLIMKYYHSELVMKNVFYVHFIKWLHQHNCH